MPTIKRGKKVQIIIQKKSKFIDLRRIAKNNVDVLNGVLMANDFKGYKQIKGFLISFNINDSAKQYVNGFINTNVAT